MKKIIKFEGFADYGSGNEFGLPIVMVHPKRLMTDDHGNIGGVEHMIEDYMIDLSLEMKPKHDPYLSKNRVDEDFEKAKKGNKRFKKWSAVVEYDTNSFAYDFGFDIVKKTGF